jgi:hypothetical protein
MARCVYKAYEPIRYVNHTMVAQNLSQQNLRVFEV